MVSPVSAPMPGRMDKPFCGDCCSEHRKGSGHRNKRIATHARRTRERAQWRSEVRDDR